ncbi:MAG TPA: hydrogenase maturation protease [Euryarchaeota archaeon]|nr:MAG: hypothetical protein DRN57_01680 [Thermoplasmata archaeon]HHD15747.1 hydrogenase maturation protease [Euryarchaeota archaeon]
MIGVGNDLMGDDGIGPHIARILKNGTELPPEVDAFDEGRGGMRLLHHIKGYDGLVIIDAADIGKDPGDYIVFRPEEVESERILSGRSVHEWDLMKVLELSRMMGECPSDVRILAVQPKVLRMGEGISGELLEREDEYVERVLELVRGP